MNGIIYENNISDFGSGFGDAEDELQRQLLIKDHINMYYDDYYLKAKKKKTSKVKRSYSKKPGARCKHYR
jgi:hypothetical protein